MGSVVTQHLLEMGYAVRCFDNLIYKNHAAAESFLGHPNYDFKYGDLCNSIELEKCNRRCISCCIVGRIGW